MTTIEFENINRQHRLEDVSTGAHSHCPNWLWSPMAFALWFGNCKKNSFLQHTLYKPPAGQDIA